MKSCIYTLSFQTVVAVAPKLALLFSNFPFILGIAPVFFHPQLLYESFPFSCHTFFPPSFLLLLLFSLILAVALVIHSCCSLSFPPQSMFSHRRIALVSIFAFLLFGVCAVLAGA